MIISEEAYLSHFGVLGMKWGVRRDRKPSDKNKKKAKDDKREARARKSLIAENKRVIRRQTQAAANALTAKRRDRLLKSANTLIDQNERLSSGEGLTAQDRAAINMHKPNYVLSAAMLLAWTGVTAYRFRNEIRSGADFVQKQWLTPKPFRDIRLNYDDAVDVYSNVAGPIRIAGALQRGGH